MNQSIYICPRCRTSLAISDGHCASCNLPIEVDAFGIVSINGANFPDHDHERALKAFENGNYEYYADDERLNMRFINDFSAPLLASLYDESERPTVRVLSVGCGVGIDVEILRNMGYNAWGMDCGSRCMFWLKRQYPDRLVRCTDESLPFPDNFFDFVMCHQVLEHVGVVDDSTTLQRNYRERRKQFLHNLLRVTKSGGYLNIATPNRLFPVDPGHAPNFMGVRVHGPHYHFLTSYGDMARYCHGHIVKPLSPRHYYAGTSLATRGTLGKLFTRYLTILDRFSLLRGTFLNPLTNVLIQKVPYC